MAAWKLKPYWGLPESFGDVLAIAVELVTHALCLALTLSIGGVFALEEFLIEAELHDNHDQLSRLLIDNF